MLKKAKKPVQLPAAPTGSVAVYSFRIRKQVRYTLIATKTVGGQNHYAHSTAVGDFYTKEGARAARRALSANAAELFPVALDRKDVRVNSDKLKKSKRS